ncbi:MAG: SBBP repeat-containing protein, partial [Desulfofustis sp.]|nr:SBBP repeat-containing protein [Desulfofustis sp.]
TYVVHPGGNPADISLRYNAPISLTPLGELRADFNSGYMTESAPVAWQEIDGKKRPVAVAFELQADCQVRFTLGDYRQDQPVYIDPIYRWHAFFGSDSWDYGEAIALDGAGNIYITGLSHGAWNGPGDTAPLNPYVDADEIFVLKLDSAGAYQWHTFFGTWGEDRGISIVVGKDGDLYVSGRSLYDWNGPGNVEPLNHNNGTDFVVIKLGADGAYQFHTFIGSGAYETYPALTLDGSDNIYLASASEGDWGTPINPYSGDMDMVIVKLDKDGSLVWSTFLGSSGYDDALAITVDSTGAVYAAGRGAGTWNGPGGQSPRNGYNAGYDIAVVKLDTDGAYLWHTFLGSSADDAAYALAVNADGDLYLTGNSQNVWNGPGDTPPLHTNTNVLFDPAGSVFIAKLDSDGYYQWHTLYGMYGSDTGRDLGLDPEGNLYITGDMYVDWGFASPSPVNPYHGSDGNALLLKLDANGAYRWHAFFDGFGYGLALDRLGSVYLTGGSAAGWDGPGTVAPLYGHSGQTDILILKTYTSPTPIADFSQDPATGTAPLDVIFNDTSTGPPADGWAWYFGNEEFTGAWSQMTASAAWSVRSGSTAVAQPDGGIVLLGGDYVRDVWRSTDQGGSWTQIATTALWSTRGNYAAVALPDSSIVLLGGRDWYNNRKDVWRSTDNGANWYEQIGNAGWPARAYHTAEALADGSM